MLLFTFALTGTAAQGGTDRGMPVPIMRPTQTPQGPGAFAVGAIDSDYVAPGVYQNMAWSGNPNPTMRYNSPQADNLMNQYTGLSIPGYYPTQFASLVTGYYEPNGRMVVDGQRGVYAPGYGGYNNYGYGYATMNGYTANGGYFHETVGPNGWEVDGCGPNGCAVATGNGPAPNPYNNGFNNNWNNGFNNNWNNGFNNNWNNGFNNGWNNGWNNYGYGYATMNGYTANGGYFHETVGPNGWEVDGCGPNGCAVATGNGPAPNPYNGFRRSAGPVIDFSQPEADSEEGYGLSREDTTRYGVKRIMSFNTRE